MGRIRFLLLVAGLMLATFPASARSVQNPSQCDPVLTVRRGDMFSLLIARHFGKQATWTQFTRFNRHIADPNLIVPGDEICVPKAELLFGPSLPPSLERIVEIRVTARLKGAPAAQAPAPAAAATRSDRERELILQNVDLVRRVAGLESELRVARAEAQRMQRQPAPAATPPFPPAHLDSALIAGSCATACATAEYPSTCLAECNEYFTLNQGKDYTSLLGRLFREIYDLRRASADLPAAPGRDTTSPLSAILAIVFAMAALVLLFKFVGARNISYRLRQALTRSEELIERIDDARDNANRRTEKATADIAAVERANAELTAGIRERDAKILRFSETEAGRTIERLDGDVARLTAELEEARDVLDERYSLHAVFRYHYGNDEAAVNTVELFGDLAAALKAHAQLREALQFASRDPLKFLERMYGDVAGPARPSRMRLMTLIRARRGAISSEAYRGVEIGRLAEWIALLDGHEPDDRELRLAYRTIEEQARTRLSDLVPEDDAARRHDRGEIRFLEEVIKTLGTESTVVSRTPTTPPKEAVG